MRARDGKMSAVRSMERVKRLGIESVSASLVKFRASLEDICTSPEGSEVVHSLLLEGTLSIPDLVIMTVEPYAKVQPHAECKASLAPMQRLVGQSISKGYSSRVRDLLGGTAGCSHFMAMALDLAASHTLCLFLQIRDRVKREDDGLDGVLRTRVALTLEPRLENACIALTSRSPQIQHAKQTR